MSTRGYNGLVVLALVGAGCLPSFALSPDGGAPSSGPAVIVTDGGVVLPANADLATPPDLAIDPVALFNANVAPILVGADGTSGSCGGCHDKAGGIGPGFFVPNPDILTTMLAYPGLVGETPETSRLYMKGAHEGPALTPVQAPIVHDWIVAYNLAKPKPADGGVARPTVKPFSPVMGANTIDLSVLDPSLAGMSISFTAKMAGTSLELSAITIKTTAAMGLHVVHPLWVTWDAMMTAATPDPIDSFSNLDETVAPASSSPMGPGTLFLPNFASSMLVNVVFSTLEPKGATGGGDGGTVALGCKSVTTWASDAKPQLSASCVGCHGGGNGSATMAYSLASANGDSGNCADTLGEMNLTTPSSSRLFSYPDPNAPNNGHPFHFPDTATYTTFMNDVGMWIANEK